MADPKVRKDGKCAHCRKPKPVLRRSLRKYAGDQYDNDPFCSSWCCRTYHGCQVPGDEESEELRLTRSNAGKAARMNYDAVKAYR